MTPEYLDALAAKARAATPGPWQVYEEGLRPEDGPTHFRITNPEMRRGTIVRTSGYSQADADEAAHIAANSPDVTLALIARIRELEGQLVRPK